MQDKTIILELLQNCAEKMQQKDKEEREKDPIAYNQKWKKYFQDEAIMMEQRSKERKELYDSIQMSDEMYKRRFTI